MKDYHDLFDEHDAKMEAEMERYIREAPRCCYCKEPILDNDAIYVEGEWYCRDEECMNEFYSNMRIKYMREIA